MNYQKLTNKYFDKNGIEIPIDKIDKVTITDNRGESVTFELEHYYRYEEFYNCRWNIMYIHVTGIDTGGVWVDIVRDDSSKADGYIKFDYFGRDNELDYEISEEEFNSKIK